VKVIAYILCIFAIASGCSKPAAKDTYNGVVTFPVNDQCHDYVSHLTLKGSSYEVSYKPFTIKLDAFPQISGFMALRSNNMLNVELQNEAIRVMDDCFARAKTTIEVATPEDWVNAGKAIQSNLVNGVPVHSLVLTGSRLDIYYNWNDKEQSR
tara:strand:- start:19 stop:477 length:459 start_codon:yes stop_codon:yes gene_type:complete